MNVSQVSALMVTLIAFSSAIQSVQGFYPGGLRTGVSGSGFRGGYNSRRPYGRGSYLSNSNGTFLNPVGEPYSINPLSPFNWGANAPLSLNGSSFTTTIGNTSLNYWKAESGYFYPWFNQGNQIPYLQNGNTAFFSAPVLFLNGSSSPVAKLPSPSVQLNDFLKYIEACVADKKISESLYQEVKLRTNDLQKKQAGMIAESNGVLDPESEDEIRTDIENLTKELTEHLSQ